MGKKEAMMGKMEMPLSETEIDKTGYYINNRLKIGVMIKALIVDDEENARGNLQVLLKDYCEEVTVVAMLDNVTDGLKAAKKHKPDLIFLDIEMNGETGFDLLSMIEDIDFDVVFTTAHSDYALKAFKFNATDYLLKPIDIDELIKAVSKTSKRLGNQLSKNKMDQIISRAQQPNNPFKKIALPTVDGLIFVERDHIIRCESADNYTTFYLHDGSKIMVSKTIKHFEEMLSEYNFFRVHQSHLINLRHLKQYHKGEGGYAIMSDDSSVIVSRRKKEAFLSGLSAA